MEWRLGDSLGISDRGTKTKSITSCDNAFVTNIGAAAATLSRKKHLLARDPGAKRSGSSDTPRKAHSRNGNQPYVMEMSLKYGGIIEI
ncbi:hypothetical protein [Lysinibacillus sp. TE18511]